jgi:hypothetical protein
MLEISRLIELMPLSMNGAGITRLEPMIHICHFSVCAESFGSVLQFAKLIDLDMSAHILADGSLHHDGVRSQLFPALNMSINHLVDACSSKMTMRDFAISPAQEYRGLQKLISTSYYHTLHTRIVEKLPEDRLKAWFSSRKDTFSSLALNSSVRHFTHQRPPPDKIFPVVLAMRTLRPIFHLYRCKCGEMVDVCGFHTLKCVQGSPTAFVSVHNGVRDATVKALQDYTRRNAPSPLHIYSEAQKFHLCEIKNYYDAVEGAANHRADAVVFEDADSFHPWFLDFVQAQIDNPNDNKVMDHLNRAHQAKISALVRDYGLIPRESVVPMAFASNGVFHPASLAFIDWFLCRASRVPISEPPSIEKLMVLQRMSSAIVDRTATIISSHFYNFITSLHEQSFPLVLASARQAPERLPGRRAHRVFSQSAASPSQSQHSELTPPSDGPPPRSASPPAVNPPPAVRASARLREKFTAGGAAVGSKA